MTLRERFNKVTHFQEVDRIPNAEFAYWGDTLNRWREEGMPEGVDINAYFGLDCNFLGYEQAIPVDLTSPMPHPPKHPISSMDDFEEAKELYNPHSPERYPQNWDALVESHKKSNSPLGLRTNGFFGQPRAWMSFSRICLAYYDKPDLLHAMGDFWADFVIDASRKALEEVDIDYVLFWEDMSGKQGSIISPQCFREFMTPYYKRVTDFIRESGVDILICDTDGNINDMVELFLEAGINCLTPLEIRAGTDPVAIRKKYPNLVIFGGMDKTAVIEGPDAIDREMERVHWLIEQGGYIPHIDHLVPPDTSLANYKYYIARKREIIGGDLRPLMCDLTNAREEALKPSKPYTYEIQSSGPKWG